MKKWMLYRWVWQLRSPLFIGATAAGPLNRCRLYIPARAIWGALTAEITRLRNVEASNVEDLYKEVGQKLAERARFTYLYPARKVGERWCAWLPYFEEDKGLCWRREEYSNDDWWENRQFRNSLLDARSSTAIDPNTGSATEGLLRETECIQPFWADDHSGCVSPVGMVGYIFLRVDDPLHDDIRKIGTISIGGDTRYGLGHLVRVDWNIAEDTFGFFTRLDEESSPIVDCEYALAHAISTSKLIGNLELLMGWDRFSLKQLSAINGQNQPLWVPGSRADRERKWSIMPEGIWDEHP